MAITRRQYYENLDIIFEIIKQHMHGRETFFLPYKFVDNKFQTSIAIRWLMANYVKMMYRHMEKFGFFDVPTNLYHGLATYDLPQFSYNYRVKSEQQKIWKDNFQKYVKSYDLFVETDSPDLGEARKDTLFIKEFYDSCNMKYCINFSGSKGFHTVVPSAEFDFLGIINFDASLEARYPNIKNILRHLPMTTKSIREYVDKVILFKLIALRMNTILAIDSIDTGVQDVKRVKKTAYSWDVKSNLIAYPLDDEQLKNFNTGIVAPDKVITYNNRKRGLLFRNTDIPPVVRSIGIMKMLVELGILTP